MIRTYNFDLQKRCALVTYGLRSSTAFEDNSGAETLGDYETAGSLDYWYGNNLYFGSHNGAEIEGAFSVGECSLLTNVTEFMCIAHWII